MRAKLLALAFIFIVLLTSGAHASTELPPGDRPVAVKAGFMLYDINEIEESTETFEFEGALLLSWRDTRQAFDPETEGVTERVYKGSYQYTELYDGWRPQAFLANESGAYDRQGIVLRVEPDGTVWYVEEIDAIAESPMDLRFFPFDEQTLQIHFKFLGYGADEVRFEPVAEYSRLLSQRWPRGGRPGIDIAYRRGGRAPLRLPDPRRRAAAHAYRRTELGDLLDGPRVPEQPY
jgi:hypothetical protein